MWRASIIALLATIFLTSIIIVACSPVKGTAEWHANQAYELNEQGYCDEAIKECNKAIELDPDYAMAYNNRACAYNYKVQYDLAIADFNKAIELDPNLASAYVNRAWAYQEQGKNAEAIADL